MTRKSLSSMVLLFCCFLAIGSTTSAQFAANNTRFRWVNLRLREVGNVGRKFHLVKKPVLLKLDTATGKVWRYSPENLTVDVEGKKGEYGHFKPIEAEGLPNLVPKPKEKTKKGGKEKPDVLRLVNNRFGLSVTSIQKTVSAPDDETAGLIDQDKLFLTDQKSGNAWILKTVVETVKEKGKEDKKFSRHMFVRLFNAGELVVIGEDGRASKPT